MEERDSSKDPLARLIMDHEEVSEHLEILEEILNFLGEKEVWSKIKLLENFFKRNVTDHFEFEEKTIFPAILSGTITAETIKLILELQGEHGRILKELEGFRKIISENTVPLNKEASLRLKAAGKEVMHSLLRHASKEDEKLLPILKRKS